MDAIASARNFLRHAVNLWPARMKLEAIRAICEGDPEFVQQYGRKLVSIMSKQLGINGIRATGAYGEIVSSPDDLVVFAGYSETGRWAEYSNALFDRFFEERGGGTYIDIGANIGLTTIPIAKRQNVQCLAFEPDETNFHNLRFNITQNCLDGNVKLHKIALFESETELSFSVVAQGNLGDHRIQVGTGGDEQLWEHRRKIRTVTTVRAMLLDSFRKEVRGPLAIKIDTQGAEPFVFAGGRNTIEEAELMLL
jgi:FkbM family methyltransferase